MKRGVDYIGVGCGAVIVKGGKIFLMHRGDLEDEAGVWSIPGGGVELGETRAEAVVREMKEEIGCTVEVLDNVVAVDHINGGRHWVTTSFLCRVVEGEPKNLEPSKCQDIGWFTLEEAKDLPLATFMPSSLDELSSDRFNKYFA